MYNILHFWGKYDLEKSSPGVNKMILKAHLLHFRKYCGIISYIANRQFIALVEDGFLGKTASLGKITENRYET